MSQLLKDAELVTDRGATYATLVLLGTHAALGRFLPQAETVFEYRSSENAGPANQREEFRKGFLLYYDRVWELVNQWFLVTAPSESEENSSVSCTRDVVKRNRCRP